MNGLDLRRLEYFVAVAEERHFGRAAERLRMTQPPLSRAVQQLEDQLGVRLLTRTTRRVELTPAGEVLLRDARTALDAVAAAERRTRHAAAPSPTLRVALKADLDAGLLPAILAAFAGEPEACEVELVLVGIGEQAQALRDGRADAAIVPAPYDAAGLDAEPLAAEPTLLALAAADPLAALDPLRLADLAGYVLPGGRPADQFPAEPGSARTSARPSRRHTVADLTEILRLVEVGSMVAFLPRSVTRRYPRPEIAYRAVADVPDSEFSLAWPQQATSRTVVAFVRAAEKAAASAPVA
ncbi:DNA-binding transcriptional LysR family regulator [Catenulispora sp. GP43]|uniref:LysR family transcriptional regulator n=1 Tax=Catenulispora sp. GP43 TaxID=3156263 RepID=UPI003510E8FF